MTYINMDKEGLQDDIVKLISGETIVVDTDSFENDLETFKSKDDVLTLLIHLGYLAYGEENDSCEEIHEEPVGIARIPNEEIRNEFHGILRKGHNSTLVRLMCTSDQLLRDTLEGKCMDQYSRVEEMPTGHGIADVVFVPKRRSLLPAMIVELKWNKTAEGAIAQIKDRNYPAALQEYGGEIVLVGVNYNVKTKEHTCRIEMISV